MSTKYQDYKMDLLTHNITIDDSGVDLSKAIYISCCYGLYIEGNLVVTFPYFSEQISENADYKEVVNKIYGQYGQVRRVALYMLSDTKQFFAVPKIKRALINFDNRDRSRDQIDNKVTKTYPATIKISFEDITNNYSFGVLHKNKKSFTFMPMIIFNSELCSPNIRQGFFALAPYLKSGDLVTGNWYLDMSHSYNNTRMFKITHFPAHLKHNREIHDIPCFYDYLIHHNLSKTSLKRNEHFFFNDRAIKKSIFIGEPINFDWFGREFGYWIKGAENQVLRLYSGSYTDKGISPNLKDNY